MVEIKTREEFNEAIAQDGNVFVKFSASWCGPCKILKKNIDEVENDGTDIKFYSMDIEDGDQELIEELGIQNIPYSMTYKNGIKTGDFVGTRSTTQIIELFA